MKSLLIFFITFYQNSGGGKSRVEELLEQLIMVTREGGNISIDGTKVSAAVNSANYRV